MKTSYRKFAPSCGTTVMALTIATVASAQQAPADSATARASSAPTSSTGGEELVLNTVVVTARKREERLQDVPESITALSSADLETSGIVSFDDLGRQTPGLTMVERQNNTPDVAMRGVGSYGNVQGVGFYIDDVLNFTDQTERLHDVERVEILKGPQGTLYGGSSLGGAIRYISKTPALEGFSAETGAEAGTKGYQDVYAAVNAPIVEDKAAVRVSAYYTHDDGFLHDENLNVLTDQSTESGVRAQLLVKPTDEFKALLTLRYRNFFGGAYAYEPQNSVSAPSYESDLSFTPHEHLRTWAGILNMSYDLGFASLASITSGTTQSIDLHADADYKPAPTLNYSTVDARPSDVYTQEFRLTSEKSGMLDWIAGLYAQRTSNILLNPSPTSLLLNNSINITPYTNYDTSQADLAAFGSADLHMGPVTLTGGLRVNNSDYRAAVDTVGGAPVDKNLSVNDTVALPKASLSYKAPDGTLLYMSAAKGVEAGKVDPTVNPPVTYKPETDWTYEVGAKGYLVDRVLYYELSAFYIKEHDRQVETVEQNSAGLLIKRIDNIGDSTSKGVDIALSWRPVRGLSFDGALEYLNARWDADAKYALTPIGGKSVPNAPEWTANLGATYSLPVSDTLKVTLHADAAYTDDFQWQVAYAPISNTNPPYWVALARIALGSQDGRWEVAFRGDNLFDKKYYTEFNPLGLGPQAANGTCVGCDTGAVAPRQRFIVSLTTRF